MDDILLAHSDADTFEKMFDKVQKTFPCWLLQIALENTQRDFINYLGYDLGLQKIHC